MSAINIRRDVSDSFYRYKMPRLISKIEGKGNGIKTVIPNMSEISKALGRPPGYPTKYFGCELGAQTKTDETNDRYIVNGAHDAPKLQSLLDGFIQKFVLCSSCENPETDLIISKNGDICRDCKACGARTDVDMRHKLITFILKNPPDGSAAPGAKSTLSKKDRRRNKIDGTNTNDVDNGSPPKADSADADVDDKSDDEFTRKIFADAAAQESTFAKGSQMEDWSADVSSAAVINRQRGLGLTNVQDLADQLDAAAAEDDAEDNDDESDPYDVLAQFLEGKAAATDTEILSEMKELRIKDYKAVTVLAQVIFDENILKQLPRRLPLFQKLVTTEKAQKGLLGGIERLVGVKKPSLMPKMPLILKAFYDADLLAEEVILSWGKKASKKYVDKDTSKEIRKKAEQFLQWLEEAEEESSDDEDE